MTDALLTPVAELPAVASDAPFDIEVSFTIRKNGGLWSKTSTESFTMDQTTAVIAQHACVGAVQDALFRMGAAAAAEKDPSFDARYKAVRALLSQ